MRKIEISIDLTAIKGAQRMTSNRGKDILVIDLAESRAKPHQNGKVYFNLEAIENKNGPNDYGNTHFVKEKATKEERDAREDLPFLGNGKLFDSEARREEQPRQERRERPAPRTAQRQQAAPGHAPEHFEACEDEDIPF